MAFSVQEILNSILRIPQTQADIRELAKTSEQATDPVFQAQMRNLVAKAEVFAIASLALSAVGTAIALGSFFMDVREKRKRRRRRSNPSRRRRRR